MWSSGRWTTWATSSAASSPRGGQIYEVDLDRGREERTKNPSAVFAIRLPGRRAHVRLLAAISELESVYTIDEI